MQNTVILITHEGMGHAHDIALLPLTLIEKYLGLIIQGNLLPARRGSWAACRISWRRRSGPTG